MTSREWKPFLQAYSRELLSWAEIAMDLDEAAVDSAWLGFAPALPKEIAEAEHRLGVSLPSSLRSFYAVTNGWRTTGTFIWEVLPVTKIGWLRDLVPHLYDIAAEVEQTPGPFQEDPDDARLKEYRWEQGTRVKRSLVLNLEGDASFWLLDPGTLNAAGEWAAGRWSSWNPAMEWETESFATLMQSELASFRTFRDHVA